MKIPEKALYRQPARYAERRRGQSLVEFALIVPILLLILFALLEVGRAFHAYAVVQSSAQEGARVALTGRCRPDFNYRGTPIDCTGGTGARDSIYSATEVTAHNLGLGIADPHPSVDGQFGDLGEPGYFRTIIVGTDRDGLPLADQPGAPGGKTFVRVTYNMPVIAPIVSSIAPVIRFEAESVVTNETQGGSLSQEGVLPPSLDIEEFQEDPDDGIDDDWEYTYFGSPGAYDETGDPDGDGCDNECEYNHPANALFPDGLDPTNPDTDADDLPDGWEIDNGLDPLDPNPPVGRDDDPDGDTFSNYDEYLADTNPMDINDFPGVFNASMTLTPLGIEQGAGDIVVDVSVTDDTATPIAGLNPATDFTWTITPDPGVGGPIFNTYDGDSYLFDMPAGIYPPDAYDIELTVDDGTSDETMNEAFAVIPPGSCDVTPDANFTYAADTITWGMDNDGFQDVTVRQVTVVWPDGAAELDQLDSVKWQRGANPLLDIWTGSADTSPTDFGDSTANTWNQPNDRDLSPTETGQIELHFTQPNVETSGNTYTITVEFELVSTPGGTACSVSDTQTY